MWILFSFIAFCMFTIGVCVLLLGLEKDDTEDKKEPPKIKKSSLDLSLLTTDSLRDMAERWKHEEICLRVAGHKYFTKTYNPSKSTEVSPYDIQHFLISMLEESKRIHIGKGSELKKQLSEIESKISRLLNIKHKLEASTNNNKTMQAALEQSNISLDRHRTLRDEINESISKIDVIYSRMESKINGLNEVNEQYLIVKSLEDIDSEIDIEIEQFDQVIAKVLGDIRLQYNAITRGLEHSKTIFVMAGAENKSIPISAIGE